MNIKGSMIRKPHPVSIHHKDVYSLQYHGITTGAFRQWYKKTFPEDYKRLSGSIVDRITYAYKHYLEKKLKK
jgi:hypothetical protein